MRKYAGRLQDEVDRKIRYLNTNEPDVVLRALTLSEFLEDTIGQLKQYVVKYEFKDEGEEIEFFKKIKPGLYRYLLYYRKLYYIEINRPQDCIEQQGAYLKRELSCLQPFIERRIFLYRYFRSGATYLDSYLFLRKNIHLRRVEQFYGSFMFERDPTFSTLCDFEVAKFMAHDMLRDYIMEELTKLENPIHKMLPKERITWTHSKTELIELLYSLDTDGCFNHGKIPLYKIAYYFEQVFNIDLGNNIARNFFDMRIRQRPTPFIDRLRERLQKRMNDYGDEPDYNKHKRKR